MADVLFSERVRLPVGSIGEKLRKAPSRRSNKIKRNFDHRGVRFEEFKVFKEVKAFERGSKRDVITSHELVQSQ